MKMPQYTAFMCDRTSYIYRLSFSLYMSEPDPHRFPSFYENRSEFSESPRNPQKGTLGIKKSRTFRKGAHLEGTRCFRNWSPFILDPRLHVAYIPTSYKKDRHTYGAGFIVRKVVTLKRDKKRYFQNFPFTTLEC